MGKCVRSWGASPLIDFETYEHSFGGWGSGVVQHFKDVIQFCFLLDFRRFAVVASMTSRPADACLGEIMEDDRLLKKMNQVRESTLSEVAYVNALDRRNYERFATVAGGECTGPEIAHDVIHGVHVTTAYLQEEVLTLDQKEPWHLAVGNVRENLERLRGRADPPPEFISGRIWRLMHNARVALLEIIIAVTLWLDQIFCISNRTGPRCIQHCATIPSLG